MTNRNRLAAAAFAGASLFAAACAEPSFVEPTAQPTATSPLFSSSGGSVLVECPTDQAFVAEGSVGLLGGSISAGGTTITIPAGAVLLPVAIRLEVPASQYMEVSITANGADHFDFLKTVSVSIDYSRCTRSNIDKGPLAVFYIDEASKALLENMGGTDDKTARKITFLTDHLSGYAIAN